MKDVFIIINIINIRFIILYRFIHFLNLILSIYQLFMVTQQLFIKHVNFLCFYIHYYVI